MRTSLRRTRWFTAALAAAAVAWAGPALAGGPLPTVQVPSPGALTVVSAALAAGLVAARFLRRK